MNLEQLENNWNQKFNQTLLYIKDIIKEDPLDDLETKRFKNFSKWIVEGDIPTYDFLTTEFHDMKDNPFKLERFLNTLHHSMLDDGDYCFAIMKLDGQIKSINLLFMDRHSNNFESVLQDINKDLINSIICGRDKVINFANKINHREGFEKLKVPMVINKENFYFSIHSDEELFVRQVEKFVDDNKIKNEVLEEKRKSLLSKLGR